jgi:outer membrane protein OmpA-like peptidoglycan-associated protein
MKPRSSRATVRAVLAALALVAPVAFAQAPDAAVAAQRLAERLDRLERDRELAGLALAEIGRARDAVRELAREPARRADARAVQIGIAEDLVAVAEVTARAIADERRVRELEQRRAELIVAITRRDAEAAQREAERLRVLSLARAEEAERARRIAEEAMALTEQSAEAAEAERRRAEQARRVAEARARETELARREAELAVAAAESLRIQREVGNADTGAGRFTLGEGVFAPGRAELTAEAAAQLDQAAAFVGASPGRRARIEGHTDSRGSANLNQALSQQRAEAVRQALIARGIDGARLVAVGRGSDRPIASNDTPEGRARNRRVEIILE